MLIEENECITTDDQPREKSKSTIAERKIRHLCLYKKEKKKKIVTEKINILHFGENNLNVLFNPKDI